jgi:hypothetical protein
MSDFPNQSAGFDAEDLIDESAPSMAMPYDRESEDEWVPKSALEALAMDKYAFPERTPVEHAEQMLVEGAPAAASAIVHLAIHSNNERIRLDAAKYVIDAASNYAPNHKKYARSSANASGKIEDALHDIVGTIYQDAEFRKEQDNFNALHRPHLKK